MPHGITLAVALVQKTSVKAQVTAPRLCRLIVEIMRVVICGAGVVGACTAYFLSRRGIDVIVLERTDVAAAASGKAGGFLALDWCAGTPLDALARRSFELTRANSLPQSWAPHKGTVPNCAQDRSPGWCGVRMGPP